MCRPKLFIVICSMIAIHIVLLCGICKSTEKEQSAAAIMALLQAMKSTFSLLPVQVEVTDSLGNISLHNELFLIDVEHGIVWRYNSSIMMGGERKEGFRKIEKAPSQ